MYKLNEYLHTNNNNLAKNNILKKGISKKLTRFFFPPQQLIFSVILISSKMSTYIMFIYHQCIDIIIIVHIQMYRYHSKSLIV
jgi:hypothetical protein